MLVHYYGDGITATFRRSLIRMTAIKIMLDEFALYSNEGRRMDAVCKTLHANVTRIAYWLPDSVLCDYRTDTTVYLHTALSLLGC